MAVEHFRAEWESVALRTTRTVRGHVEIDLIWRQRGAVQTTVPLISISNPTDHVTAAQEDYVISYLTDVAHQLLAGAFRDW